MKKSLMHGLTALLAVLLLGNIVYAVSFSEQTPADGSYANSLVQPISVVIDGEGKEIREQSILMLLDGVPYSTASPRLSFDAFTGKLTFQPNTAFPPYSDGERIDVSVEARDVDGGFKSTNWRFSLDTVAPEPIAVITYNKNNDTLTWNVPPAQGAPVAFFKVYRDDEAFAEAEEPRFVETDTEEKHFYQVSAVDEAGNESAKSRRVSSEGDNLPAPAPLPAPQPYPYPYPQPTPVPQVPTANFAAGLSLTIASEYIAVAAGGESRINAFVQNGLPHPVRLRFDSSTVSPYQEVYVFGPQSQFDRFGDGTFVLNAFQSTALSLPVKAVDQARPGIHAVNIELLAMDEFGRTVSRVPRTAQVRVTAPLNDVQPIDIVGVESTRFRVDRTKALNFIDLPVVNNGVGPTSVEIYSNDNVFGLRFDPSALTLYPGQTRLVRAVLHVSPQTLMGLYNAEVVVRGPGYLLSRQLQIEVSDGFNAVSVALAGENAQLVQSQQPKQGVEAEIVSMPQQAPRVVENVEEAVERVMEERPVSTAVQVQPAPTGFAVLGLPQYMVSTVIVAALLLFVALALGRGQPTARYVARQRKRRSE